MVVALSLIFLDSSILQPVLPVIQKDLRLSLFSLRWIFNIYFLTSASFVVIGGRIADIFGYRKVLFCGLLLFSFSAFLAAISKTGAALLTARAFQGLAVSLMGPSAMSILLSTYPSKERGRALGTSIGISSIFLAFGPFIGGLLTQFYSWRILFIFMIPFSVIGLFILIFLDNKKNYYSEKLDVLSVFLLPATIGVIVFGTMNSVNWGWRSPSFFVSILIFCLLAFIFYRVSKVSRHPLIDFSLFAIPSFTIGNILMFGLQFALMNTVFWWVFFSKTFDYTPFQVGLLSLVYALPTIIISPLAGLIADRKGFDIPIVLGHICALVGCSTITVFVFRNHYVALNLSLFLTGCGISSILTAIGTFTFKDIPAYQRGMGSGIYNTVRFGAASFAIAVLGSIKSYIKSVRMSELITHIPDTENISSSFIFHCIEGKRSVENLTSILSHHKFLLIKQGYISISLEVFEILNIIVTIILFITLFFSIRHFKKR